MAKGGISGSGRALRFVLWRLPLGATRYSLARNTAAATEEGRRILALAGFGAWVAAFWFIASFLHQATGMLVPLQVAALFGLLLIWRIIGLLRRWWVHRHNLRDMAVSLQRQRQMYQMQTEAVDRLRHLAAGAGQRVSEGGVDVLGIFRTDDPIRTEQQRTSRQQQREARDMLPEEQRNMPLGDRNEPVFPMPRWLRRRGPR